MSCWVISSISGSPALSCFPDLLLVKHKKLSHTATGAAKGLKTLTCVWLWATVDVSLGLFASDTPTHTFTKWPRWKKINPSNWQSDYSVKEHCHHFSTSCALCVIWTVSNPSKETLCCGRRCPAGLVLWTVRWRLTRADRLPLAKIKVGTTGSSKRSVSEPFLLLIGDCGTKSSERRDSCLNYSHAAAVSLLWQHRAGKGSNKKVWVTTTPVHYGFI